MGQLHNNVVLAHWHRFAPPHPKNLWDSQREQGEVSICERRQLKDTTEALTDKVEKSKVQTLHESLKATNRYKQALGEE